MAMVDVSLADGRTVLRFRSRGQFIALLRRKPEGIDEERHVRCWALWHRDQEDFEPAVMSYIRANSVAFVRVIEGAERERFEEAFPEARPRERVGSGSE